MIKVTNLRTRGSEAPFDPIVVSRTKEDAFSSFVEFELGYGASVTSVTSTRIEAVTYVMTCVDTTILEGSEEDMKLLVEAVLTYLQVTSSKEHAFHDSVLDVVMKITQGIPLMVKTGGDMIRGGLYCRATLLSMIGDYSFVQQAMKMRLRDLLTVTTLVRYDGLSPEAAFDLAAPIPQSVLPSKTA